MKGDMKLTRGQQGLLRICGGTLLSTLSHWLWLPVGPAPLMATSDHRSPGWRRAQKN